MEDHTHSYNYTVDKGPDGQIGLNAARPYASDTLYLDNPENRLKGHEPLDSLPASWWNFLWQYICEVQDGFYQDVTGLYNEVCTVITTAIPGAILDSQRKDQLYQAVKAISEKIATSSEVGGIISSDEGGKVSVDESTGVATANGLGNVADVDPAIRGATIVDSINNLASSLDDTNEVLVPTNHAYETRRYGGGTEDLYGHVRITDTVSFTDDERMSADSIGVSPYVVSRLYNELKALLTQSLTFATQIISEDTSLIPPSSHTYYTITAPDITVTVQPNTESPGGLVDFYYTPTTSREYATVSVPTSSSTTEKHVLCRLRNHITIYSDDSGYWQVPIDQQYTQIIATSDGEKTTASGYGPCFCKVANKVYRMYDRGASWRQFFCFDGITLDYIASTSSTADDSSQQSTVNSWVSNYPGHLLICLTSCKPYPPEWCSSGFGSGYGIYPVRSSGSRYGWTLIAQQGTAHSQVDTWLGNSDGENNEISVPWRWGVDQNNNLSWGLCSVEATGEA